jgi:hypothetical protein
MVKRPAIGVSHEHHRSRSRRRSLLADARPRCPYRLFGGYRDRYGGMDLADFHGS